MHVRTKAKRTAVGTANTYCTFTTDCSCNPAIFELTGSTLTGKSMPLCRCSGDVTSEQGREQDLWSGLQDAC